uniref:Ig-like domain-containing protein n=1 Tax=Amphiprion percula TaxID=161767 RepID=A0A3P8UB69_AMPPE
NNTCIYLCHLNLTPFLLSIGVNGDDGLIPAERSHDIMYPCGDDVCYHVWHLSTDETSNDIAIVSNGKIQTSKLEDDESKCSLRIKDLTVEDVGSHRCQRRPNVHNSERHKETQYFSSFSASPGAPVINLMARKTLFLQCVLLTFVERGHCFTEGQQQISLMWVDETGAQLQDDAQHQIEQLHSCEVTLTVTLQRPENKKFRCQVMAGGQVQTSVELRVRARGLFYPYKQISTSYIKVLTLTKSTFSAHQRDGERPRRRTGT